MKIFNMNREYASEFSNLPLLPECLRGRKRAMQNRTQENLLLANETVEGCLINTHASTSRRIAQGLPSRSSVLPVRSFHKPLAHLVGRWHDLVPHFQNGLNNDTPEVKSMGVLPFISVRTSSPYI